MTAAKLFRKEIWLMCFTAVHPFSLNSWQGSEIPELGHINMQRAVQNDGYFLLLRLAHSSVTLNKRYNHRSFDFTIIKALTLTGMKFGF